MSRFARLNRVRKTFFYQYERQVVMLSQPSITHELQCGEVVRRNEFSHSSALRWLNFKLKRSASVGSRPCGTGSAGSKRF
jgi:hypothetical protein